MSETSTTASTREAWETRVTDLVISFASTISSLIPHLRRARIPIGVTAGVDAWDEITETLYKHMVVEAIRWSLPPDSMDNFRMPAYEMNYESYEDLSVLEVASTGDEASLSGQYLVFHSLKIPAADEQPIEAVLARVVDSNWRSRESVLVERSISAGFRCLLRLKGQREPRAALVIRL